MPSFAVWTECVLWMLMVLQTRVQIWNQQVTLHCWGSFVLADITMGNWRTKATLKTIGKLSQLSLRNPPRRNGAVPASGSWVLIFTCNNLRNHEHSCPLTVVVTLWQTFTSLWKDPPCYWWENSCHFDWAIFNSELVVITRGYISVLWVLDARNAMPSLSIITTMLSVVVCIPCWLQMIPKVQQVQDLNSDLTSPAVRSGGPFQYWGKMGKAIVYIMHTYIHVYIQDCNSIVYLFHGHQDIDICKFIFIFI